MIIASIAENQAKLMAFIFRTRQCQMFNTYYLMQAIAFSQFPILVHQIRPHQQVDM